MSKTRVWLICAAAIVAACAPTNVQPKPEVVTPRYDVEVETMEDQANSAVNASPTSFSVKSAAEDNLYWARASLFFKQYTDSFHVNKDTVKSVPGQKSRFIYEVSRVNEPLATKYTVKCVSGGGINTSTDVLARNAKNLARFIREGNLELSLLER
jgi:hypothetical protein